MSVPTPPIVQRRFMLAAAAGMPADLEVDVGTPTASNVIFAQTQPVLFTSQTMGMTIPLFGGAPFRANGARFFATSSVNGLSLTDVRLLLTQSRA